MTPEQAVNELTTFLGAEVAAGRIAAESVEPLLARVGAAIQSMTDLAAAMQRTAEERHARDQSAIRSATADLERARKEIAETVALGKVAQALADQLPGFKAALEAAKRPGITADDLRRLAAGGN